MPGDVRFLGKEKFKQCAGIGDQQAAGTAIEQGPHQFSVITARLFAQVFDEQCLVPVEGKMDTTLSQLG